MRVVAWLLAWMVLLAPVLSQEGVVVALDVQSLTVKPLGKSEYEAGFQVGALTQNRPWNGPMAYRAVVSRGGYEQVLSGQFAARRGVNFDRFRFAIPTTEPEGPFKLRLEVSADGQRGVRETSFEHTVALPVIGAGGPEAIIEGEPCLFQARVISGTPPFRWKWKAGDRSGEAEGPEFAVTIPDARFPRLTWAVLGCTTSRSMPTTPCGWTSPPRPSRGLRSPVWWTWSPGSAARPKRPWAASWC